MELSSELYPQGCSWLEGSNWRQNAFANRSLGKVKRPDKKPELQIHGQLVENPHYILIDVIAPISRHPNAPCQNGHLHFCGNHSNAAAHFCRHRFCSLSPFVVTLTQWVLQRGGRRSRVASLLLSLKKPLVHFRKGPEQSKDSDDVNLKQKDFALIGSRKKQERGHKQWKLEDKKQNSLKKFQKKPERFDM